MNAVTKIKPDVEVVAPATDPLAKLREPFPAHHVSKLPKESKAQREEREKDRTKGVSCPICGGWHHKNAVHLDYVGHAAMTDRLLDTDPHWSWEPMAFREGLPAFDGTGGLWIKLTVCGVTRLGYGHAGTRPGMDAGAREKEVIGDALRNAAMRFGAALELWHKGDLHVDAPEEPAPSLEERAIAHLTTCAIDRGTFKAAWEQNKDGWKATLDGPAYARLVKVMQALAAKFPKDEPAPVESAPAPQAAAEDFGIGDDEIPF